MKLLCSRHQQDKKGVVYSDRCPQAFQFSTDFRHGRSVEAQILEAAARGVL